MIKSFIKVMAIGELTLFAFLFAQASYEQHHPNLRDDSSKRLLKQFGPVHDDRIKDLVVMDDLFYAEPLVNQ